MKDTALTQHAGGHSELSSTAAHIAGYALSESGEWLREREQNAGSRARYDRRLSVAARSFCAG
jgi:hypothetical protein